MKIALIVAGVVAWYIFAAWVVRRSPADPGTPITTARSDALWGWVLSPAMFPIIAVIAGGVWTTRLFGNWLVDTPPAPKPATLPEDWDR